MKTKVPELYRLLKIYCESVQRHHFNYWVYDLVSTPDNVQVRLLCEEDNEFLYFISRCTILNTIYIFRTALNT